jgi:hypothetical protein
MDNMPPMNQPQPAPNENVSTNWVPSFACFQPDSLSQIIRDTLLLGALEGYYLPFTWPAVTKLSELYEVAQGERPKADKCPTITAPKGTHLRRPQINFQKSNEEVAKIEQQLAARTLVDAVCWGITRIEQLVADKPEMMREVASKLYAWPIEASLDDDWSVIVDSLKKLKLGQDELVQRMAPPFYPAQGDGNQLPARRWAKQAVQCLAQTKEIQRRLANIPSARLAQLHCKIIPKPAWVGKAARLPDFSADKEAFRHWASLIREMIREQMPDFHNQSEWASYQTNSRTHAKKLGARPTKGAIQNDILDDIVAALKTIAPRQPKKESS